MLGLFDEVCYRLEIKSLVVVPADPAAFASAIAAAAAAASLHATSSGTSSAMPLAAAPADAAATAAAAADADRLIVARSTCMLKQLLRPRVPSFDRFSFSSFFCPRFLGIT